MTAALPYSAVSRCLLTMKSVFVFALTVAGSVPCAEVETVSDRAGQVGSGGGGVSWTRRTNGWLLDAPL